MNDARTTSPLRRLHNCGPGPREVFTSPPIGTHERLDLVRALSWQGFADALPPAAGATARIEPTLLVSFAGALLAQMEPIAGDVPAPADEARTWLACLLRRVTALGWPGARVALVQPHVLPQGDWQAQARRGNGPVTVHEAALTLACYAVLAPPLLLWWRPASLDWMRRDVQLHIRWITPGGGAS